VRNANIIRTAVVISIFALLTFVGAACASQQGSSDQSSNPAPSPPPAKERTPDDVVQAFQDKGLEVGNPHHVEDDPKWGTGLVPKTMDSGTRFELPSYAVSPQSPTNGSVYHFATPEDQKVLSNYFKTINESTAGAMFYSHVYETQGFILHMDGRVPKPVANQYANVLKEITG
jgi:hypothetical protein